MPIELDPMPPFRDARPRSLPLPGSPHSGANSSDDTYHTAVVYAGSAWVLVEVVETTHPYLQLPERAVTILIALAIIGFPVALVLAWIYEITRDGVRRTQAIHVEHSELD